MFKVNSKNNRRKCDMFKVKNNDSRAMHCTKTKVFH